MQSFSHDVVVISDVHLGTYGSAARELVVYLKSIHPEILVLNGDIIDIWQFNKKYFPKAHLKVIREIIRMMSHGTKVYYILGNHDEALRRFTKFSMGNLVMDNKLVLDLPSGKAWFFHGDVFDYSVKHSKWIAKLGGKGYDLLILLNTFINKVLISLGKERVSISKKVKDKVKGVISYVNDFEQNVAAIAREKGYRYVVCGHIHQPAMKEMGLEHERQVVYLNSGDWVENLTSLEYVNGSWSLYRFDQKLNAETKEEEMNSVDIDLTTVLEGIEK
ncbi:MAG: UDP-2,3-diacylglucosamine diphosphatase [Flavobacteriia bacterium]|nr:UDP-2,3-diacylglucosamine diphosphatase [Flavobacteriia bacterium]